MKTKILVLVTLILMINLSLKAGKDELEFKQNLISQIKYPKFAEEKELEADVFISLTVNEKGEIVVNQMNSLYPEFMEYIKEELKMIKVSNNNEVIGKTYYFKFSFKYQYM